jgi:hypothetical protein
MISRTNKTRNSGKATAESEAEAVFVKRKKNGTPQVQEIVDIRAYRESQEAFWEERIRKQREQRLAASNAVNRSQDEIN